LYLKRLELQGFKTFASKTEFQFSSGITAVVGPNGSGKSNIADAVRWVLGEQGQRPLRIKRTEDVIFAGSGSRARLGMAEASLTLDNSQGLLPLDYGEVTLTRRAYRSGESEYFINKSRVRLRQVVDLLLKANLGQNTYTVIGQGLVDAALSLRPEERRGLFEEAADIKRYQLRRQEAMEKLTTTEQNLVRASDIIAEIGPRLKTLKEQARRARELEALRQELRVVLIMWYSHEWQKAQEALGEASLREAQWQNSLAELRASLERHSLRCNDLRAQQQGLRLRLGQWHQEASSWHAQAETVERRLAVNQERQAWVARQGEELAQEVASLEALLALERRKAMAIEDGLTALDRQILDQEALVRQAQKELSSQEATLRSLQQELEAQRSLAFRLAANQSEQRNRLGQLSERRKELSLETARAAETMESLGQQVEAAAKRLRGLEAAATELEQRRAEAEGQKTALEGGLAESQARQDELERALSGQRLRSKELQTRYALLAQMHQNREGYSAGVQAVLSAAGAGSDREKPSFRLQGVRGPLASLIKVDQQWEVAIEAVLGERLQGIVVDTWTDARAALDYLSAKEAGQATLLVLEAFADPAGAGPQGRTAEMAGVMPACAVVAAAPEHECLVEGLLGRVGLVEDLDAAGPALPVGYDALVWRRGQMIRRPGLVTGGAGARAGAGLLARERERRELPGMLKDLGQEIQQQEGQLAEERGRQQALQARLSRLEDALRGDSQQRERLAAQASQQERELDRLNQEVGWHRSGVEQKRQELRLLDSKEAELNAELEGQAQRLAQAQAAIEALGGKANRVELAPLREALAGVQLHLAVAQRDRANQSSALDGQRQTVGRLEEQLAAKSQRRGQLEAQNAAAQLAIEDDQRRLGELGELIAGMEARTRSAEGELERLEEALAALGKEENDIRTRLREAELAHSQAAMEVQRQRNDLVNLHRQLQMEAELWDVGQEAGETMGLPDDYSWPKQLRLQLPGLQGVAGSMPPQAAPEPEDLRRRIDHLRKQVKSLGAINPDAVAEYEETLGRYTFLTSQVQDLQQAARSLRTVIAELDALMQRRFEETFTAVAEEFKRCFVTLFNGGTAKLVLTDPEEPMSTGIEIIAQPPGKRLQSLALLSGGERALTAAALLFAILTINPTPFCFLDEVDAALDEANVGRFCDVLRALCRRTQFIIITHNRATMEMADAMYGVSLGDDGVSRVISLQLESHRASSPPVLEAQSAEMG
jgi:chromosome segregation protein